MKRAVAGASAGLLVLTGIAAGAVSSASAAENFQFTRLAGPDRYATAAAIAVESFNTADEVLLAAGGPRNFPDSLAGNYLAGQRQTPILLTANASLPQATRDALTRLAAKRVTILGGTSAVSAGVEAQLKSLGYTVTRISGVDRYQTASEVAETPAATTIGSEGTKGRTAILASGQNFPDALAAGPVGFAKKFPVLITTPGSLSAPTKATLQNLGIKNVLIAGGDVAVSQATENEVKALGITTTRLSGNTRQLTAVAIANYAKANLGFSSTHVDLARGDDFADALAGGPHSGRLLAPIILTDTANALGTAARGFLTNNCGTLTAGHIFGGTAAVSEPVKADATAAATCTATPTTSPTASPTATPTATATSTVSPTTSPTAAPGTNQDFVVTPNNEAINTVSTTAGANANRGQRTYTVNVGTSTVDLALIPAGDVITDANGVVSFVDADNNANRADELGSTTAGRQDARIESVNGVGVTPTAYQQDVVGGTSGVITFTIDSTVPNQAVIPVVLVDADNNNQLNLDAANQPTELFAIGGSKLFVPEESAFGNFANAEAIIVRQDQDFFTTNTQGNTPAALFNYDSGDQFTYTSGDNTANISFADFERFLSGRSTNITGQELGDFLSISYNPDPAASSTFNIVVDTPLPATNVAATVVNANPGQDADNDDIRVTWTASVSPDTDGGYNIYRRVVNADGSFGSFDNNAADDGVQPIGHVVDGTTQFNDQNVPVTGASTTYQYVVLAVNSDGDESPNSNFAQVTINAVVPSDRPISVATNFAQPQSQVEGGDATTNPALGDSDTLDRGDSLDITFEQVGTGLVLSNPSITIRDFEGTQVVLNSSNAQFNLGAVNAGNLNGGEQVLSILITSTPVGAANGSNDTQVDVFGPVAFVSSTGIANAAGAWNLPVSGCAFDCASLDSGDVTRVFSDTNFVENFGNEFLPDAVDREDVTVNTSTNQITVQADADFDTDAEEDTNSDLNVGEQFFVYDAQGQQIGSGTYNGGATTITTTTDIAPGDDLFLVFINRGGTNNSFEQLPSQTTQLINPSDIPSVENVERGTADNQIVVTFSDDDITATGRITQVSPAANYQVYDEANNTLIATGVSTVPAQGGQATSCDTLAKTCDIVVNLNNALSQDEDVNYVLRVAPNTVQDANNTPNNAETFDFDIEAQAPQFRDVMVDGTTNNTTTDATPTITGTAFDVDGVVTAVSYSTNGETFTAATPTDGSFNESEEGFTFTPTTALDEGSNNILIRATDNEGNFGFTAVTVNVNAQNPAITSAVANPTDNVIDVTFSEAVSCIGTNEDGAAEAASFIYDDQSVTNNSDGAATGVTQLDGDTCRLTVPGGIQNNDFGLLDFAQPGASTDRISDAQGGQAQSQNDVTVADVTSPILSSVVAAPAGTNSVTLTMSEPVRCADVGNDDFTVAVDNGARNVTGATCVGEVATPNGTVNEPAQGNAGNVSNTITLTFNGAATTNAAVVSVSSVPASILRDEFGLNQLAATRTDVAESDFDADGTPDSTDPDIDNDGVLNANDNNDFNTDVTNPMITNAVADVSANTVTLTYNDVVTCISASAPQFNYDATNVTTPGNANTDTQPTTVVCDGTNTVVLTFPAGTINNNDVFNIDYADDNAAFDANDVQDDAQNPAPNQNDQAGTSGGVPQP